MSEQTDDELLSALLDDALESGEAARLRKRLERDPELRARFVALERANASVRSAYAHVVDEPLPDRVRDLLNERLLPFGDHEAAPADGSVVSLAVPRDRPRRWFTPPLALAASIALAIGVALGLVLDRVTPDTADLLAEAGGAAQGSAIFAMLEPVSTGESAELAGGVTATPVLTFVTANGGYCREIDLASSRGAMQLLGCRSEESWQLMLANYSASTIVDGVYRPAAGPSPALDAAIDELIDGAPLEAAAERDVIARGWSQSQR